MTFFHQATYAQTIPPGQLPGQKYSKQTSTIAILLQLDCLQTLSPSWSTQSGKAWCCSPALPCRMSAAEALEVLCCSGECEGGHLHGHLLVLVGPGEPSAAECSLMSAWGSAPTCSQLQNFHLEEE